MLERHRGTLAVSPKLWTKAQTPGDRLQLVPSLSQAFIAHVSSKKAASVDL